MIRTGQITDIGPGKSVPQTSDDRILFGPNSISELSHTFTVRSDAPVAITAYNLGENDRLYLTHVSSIDTQYIQRVVTNGENIFLSSDNTAMRVIPAGRYRLEFEGESPLGAFYVEIVR